MILQKSELSHICTENTLGLFEFCLIWFSAGHAVIPKYFYVPADFVEAEQKKHGSQKRFPSNSGRDGMLFLWGQALYNIAKLLGEFQIHPEPRGQGCFTQHRHALREFT